MFEGIRHSYSSDGQTGASYQADDVTGSVSFHASAERSCVLSSIGPWAAVRECSASHYYSDALGRHKARIGEEVNNYS
ncbi:hypothetical protein ACUTAF_08030 [Pseudomonas sp. SP16.1]|uniref:hypothetical protein n=1 Tax=Pseudomonas sp. SP16.1 TaxID=3458854 RepID=UPI004045E4A4